VAVSVEVLDGYNCYLKYFSVLKTTICRAKAPMMEAVQTSETLGNSYQSTRRYNPEDSHLHTHRRENQNSYIIRHSLYLKKPSGTTNFSTINVPLTLARREQHYVKMKGNVTERQYFQPFVITLVRKR
jgi:hypothetical protein